MMKEDDVDRDYMCPCSKKICKDCPIDFEKVLDLKNAGLVIYRHSIKPEKDNQNISVGENGFIFQNTKDADIISKDFLPEMQKRTIKCSRCRQIMKHAVKILQKVSTISKNEIIGMCDHCKLKEHPCVECEGVLKKFFESQNDDKFGFTKERVREWLTNVQSEFNGYFEDEAGTSRERLKDYIEIYKDTKKKRMRTRSEVRFNQLSRRGKDRSERELEVRELCRQSVEQGMTIPPPIIADKSKKQILFDYNDLMQKMDDESTVTISLERKTKSAVSKTKEQSALHKDQRHISAISKHDKDSRKDQRFIDETHSTIPETQKHDFYEDDIVPARHLSQYAHDKEKRNSFEEEPIDETGHKTGFVFSFPVKRKKEEKYREQKSSSELIGDIHDRIREKNEELKRKNEEDRLKKIEEEERKQRAREEKIRLAKEKKRLAEEQKKLEAEKSLRDKLERDKARQFDKSKDAIPLMDKTSTTTSSSQELKQSKSEAKRKESHPKSKLHVTKSERKDSKTKIKDKESKSEAKLKSKPDDSTRRLKSDQTVSKTEKKTKSEIDVQSKQKADSKQPTGEIKSDLKQSKLETQAGSKQTKEDAQAESKQTKEDAQAESKQTKSETQAGWKQLKAETEAESKQLKSETQAGSKQPKAEGQSQLKEAKSEGKAESQRDTEPKTVEDSSLPQASTRSELTKPTDQAELTSGPKIQSKEAKAESKPPQAKDSKAESKAQSKQPKSEPKDFKAPSDSKSSKDVSKADKVGEKPDKENEKTEKDLSTTQKKTETIKPTEKEQEKEKEEESVIKYGKDIKTRGADEARVPRRQLEEQLAAENAEKNKPKKQKKGLKANEIEMLQPSQNLMVLDLVKVKESGKRTLSQMMTPSQMLLHELEHKTIKVTCCPMCLNSNLELEYESRKKRKIEHQEIIKGRRIRCVPAYTEEKEESDVKPLLFQIKYDDKFHAEIIQPPKHIPVLREYHEEKKTSKTLPEEESKGVIRYALSDRAFIEKGWTMLPTEKVVRKMNVYRMRPAHPEFDWFDRNKNKRLIMYDTGERLAEFDDDGRGRWFYKNQRLALQYYDAEELNAQQRFVIYSNGEPDERGRTRPYTILATFDFLGNGIVFDHGGKIRMKYNQTEGVILDRNIGPASHWKWHTLNDPPVLQQVMIDTHMSHKDPQILKMGSAHDKQPRADNEEMLAIEFDNFIKEKSKKLTQTFKPFQIRMKALKINEHFSLKVLDQANVYLIYRDGTTNIKLNLGMLLDHKEIVDTDTAELGEVANNIERLPARTDSLAAMQKSVAYAQHFERTRTERERRLRPPEPSASADKLNAATSRPLRPPLRAAYSSTGTTSSCCKSRKPSLNNVYYDNRLL